MKTDDIMAEAVRVYFSGTTAAEDTVREAWSVAAVMPRPVVMEALGAAAFRLLPESVPQAEAEVLPAVRLRLAGR